MTSNISQQTDIRKQFGHLLDQVQAPENLAFYKERLQTTQWRVALATTDKEGLLSVIAGLLTAHGANVCSADIITISGGSKEGVSPSLQPSSPGSWMSLL